MKRIIAMVLVLIMAAGMVTVSASPPGSVGNPLISRDYLEGRYAESLRADITAVLSGTVGESIARLNEIYLAHSGYSFAPRFTPITVSAGNDITIGPGASFILTEGSASITVNSGMVINVSAGTEKASDTALSLNNRYFATENTTATIVANSSSVGYVDGLYLTDGIAPPLPPDHSLGLPFTDVPATAWFHPAIEFVFRNNLFTGTTATTFSPNTSMTRGMFVTVLHRLDGNPEVDSGGTFTDVQNPEVFFFNGVTWASENGIVAGFEDGTFRPNEPVTREQMAAIMYRYATFSENDMSTTGDALDLFPDRANVSSFALDSMRWAVSHEIIRGSAGGLLLPRNTATRAEVAQIILNYTQNIG